MFHFEDPQDEANFWSKNKIREKKENNRNIKNIVFFGDGEFKGNGFGHRSVPKKELLKKLASKGLVFLFDEYGSSKYCPGCGCQMKEVIWEVSRLALFKCIIRGFC